MDKVNFSENFGNEIGSAANFEELRRCQKHGDYSPMYPNIPANQCEKCGAEMIDEANAQDRAANSRAVRIAYSQRLLAQSVIPRLCMQATLRDDPAGAPVAHLAVIKRMRKLVANFARVKETGASAFLHGQPGTGKTWIVCAVVLELVAQERQAIYTTQSELGSLARESHRDHENESERALIARFLSYDFLVIDELGSGKNSEAERKTIAEILIERHDNAKPTVVCTNLDALNIKLQFGDRLADRIAAWVDIPCAWGSYRTASEGVF